MQARLAQTMNRATEAVFAELAAPSPAGQGELDLEDEVPRGPGPRNLRLSKRKVGGSTPPRGRSAASR